MKPVKTVMIIAGESSGDHHGAKLVKAMRKKTEDLFFCGIGGPMLEEEGVRITFDASLISVVGITEIIGVFPNILRGLATVKRLLKGLRPDLLILIDFPDFNLRAAAMAKKLGIPVFYYISPQVWAWRQGRVKKIAKLVDHMAVIFPFEAALYEKEGIPVTFVGHPLLDTGDPSCEAHSSSNQVFQHPRSENAASSNAVIGLLPGSRRKEIKRHLPEMMQAALILEKKFLEKGDQPPEFLISQAQSVEREYLEAIVSEQSPVTHVRIVPGGVENTFRESDFAIAVSGTVTLEAALAGLPHIIIYKMSAITHWLAKTLAKVEHIGIANLIAKSPMIPELIQKEASPANIAQVTFDMLTDKEKLRPFKEALLETRNILGGEGASDGAATIAVEMIKTS